ncbi:hypothetical protein PsorP6_016870 [Peronosclerospora sorghi]|uniref:Uncharacterized protein n=1 Tax=Peronosclerospora sorghi TaxID=230839 RepID=A0ACC0WG05_9STRA|nr:hypothetical protein PsorP6_016870 [Peronosclerospora sorghi]
MLSLRRIVAVAPKRAFASPVQSMGVGDFRDKEKAAEAAFFNKQDEKALRKLLKKIKGQADATDKSGYKDHLEHDKKGLEKIPGLHLNDAQVDALLKWKHEH